MNPKYLVAIPEGSPAFGRANNNDGKFLSAGFVACVSRSMSHYMWSESIHVCLVKDGPPTLTW